jgi:TP901 family phage tail tape measure protein
MAGEDFLPVGIKAKVVGVDKFLGDLRRMEAGVIKFGQVVKDVGVDVRQLGQTTRTASESSKQFAQTATQMSASGRQLNTTVLSLNKAVAVLASKMGLVPPRMAAATASMSGLKTELNSSQNAVTRFFNALAVGSQKALQATGVYQRHAQQLASARQKYDQLKGTVDAVGREVADNNKEMKRAESTYKGSVRELTRLKQVLDNIDKEIKETTGAIVAFSNGTKKQQGAVAGLVAKLNTLKLQQAEAAKAAFRQKEAVELSSQSMNQQRAIAGGLANEHAELSGKLGLLGNALKGAETKMTLLNAGVSILTGSLKALGVAAAAAVVGFKLVKGAVNGLLFPLKALNTAWIKGTTAMKKFNNGLKRIASKAFRTGNSIRFLGTSMTFLVTFPIVGFLSSLTKSAIDFEEAWAGVVRTVDDPSLGEAFRLIEGNNIRDLTAAGEDLRNRFRALALDIPLAQVELAKLGEIAGTLGVRGNQNLITFVETAARLGVTTNISAEEAATALATLIGVAGGLSDAELDVAGFSQAEIDAMTESERFQISAEALGGVIVDLGNKTRAQEDQILNFARKISGAGSVIGLTSKEILAFSAAFSSVAVDSARGATAFQKTMVNMLKAVQEGGRELEIFAATAGETVGGFVKLFEEDAATALKQFVEGLGQSEKQAVAILEELELADARVFASIVTLAAAEGELTKELALANAELENQADDLNALLIESERRFSTVKNQIQLVKNNLTELGITIGEFVLPELLKLFEIVKRVIQGFRNLGKPVQKFILTALGLIAIVGPIVTGLGLMLATVGFIASAFFSFIGVILSLATGLGLLFVPIFGVIAAIGGLAIAFAAAFKKMDRFATVSATTLTEKMWQFGRGLILAFARGMAAAISAIIQVLNAIGRVISKWLKPGSPPRLLPDLDKWGAEAMTAYMEGWASADFGVFNRLADKIESFIRSVTDAADAAGKQNLVETIIGTRQAIARAVNDVKRFGKITTSSMNKIFKAMGKTTKEVRRFIKAIVEVKVATELVGKAQAEVNRIMKEYEKALKPIDKRLKQISRRQSEVSDALRIMELEEILADPRAPELVRELAGLEMEAIGLEGDARDLEDVKDTQLEVAEAELEAAELRLEAAEEELKAAEALLDVTIKNNELLQEMKDAAEEAAKKLKDASSLDVGGIAGFDEGDIEIPGFDEDENPFENVFEDLDVDSLADSVTDGFNSLVADIMKEFAPLEEQWGELGDTWAPIFERFAAWLETVWNPSVDSMLTRMSDWQEKAAELGDTIEEKLNSVIYELGGILVDLGLIDPFGPLLQASVTTIGPFSKVGKKIEEVKESFKSWVEETDAGKAVFLGIGVPIASLIARGRALKGVIEPLKNAWETLKESLSGSIDILRRTWEESEGLQQVVGFLGKAIAFTFGTIIATVIAVVIGLVNGLARAIEFAAPFIGGVIESIALTISGVISIIEGVINVIKAIFAVFRGDTEEANTLLIDAWNGIAEGITSIVKALFVGIVSIFGIFIGAIAGMVLGFVEGVIEFFVHLYDVLVGNSIVSDIKDGMIDGFQEMIDSVLEAVSGWVTDLIALATEVYEAFISGVQLALDWLTELPGKLFQIGVDAIQGFIDGVKSLDIGETLGNIGGNVLGGIKSALGIRSPSSEMEEVGESTVQGWIDGLTKQLDKIAKLFDKTVDEAIKIAESMYEKLQVLMKQSHTIMSTDYKTFLTLMLAATKSFAQSFNDTWKDALETAINTWQTFQQKLTALIPGILDSIEQFVDAILQVFIDSRPLFVASGEAIMDGLYQGMLNQKSRLIALAQRIADEIYQTIKDAYQQGSPSKLFMEVGHDMMEGWAIGIEQSTNRLFGAVEGALDPITGLTVAQPASVPASSQRQAAAPVPVNSASSIVNAEVNMGGQTITNGMDTVMLQIALEQALRNVLQ